MSTIRVGLVGLGEVAQITHLPILASMPERFEIAAICDVSAQLLQALGDQYRVAPERRYADAEALAADDGLDAVFILNSNEYHRDHAIAALQGGKHVFIEKPVCLTAEDADDIVRARDKAGKIAMVGYMRRFAPAFVEAIEDVKRLGRINYVRVRDIIGENPLFIEQACRVVRPTDIPAEASKDRWDRSARMTRAAIGERSPEQQAAFRLMCGLSTHDLSAMRELIGFPKRVLAASQWNGGSFLNALFEFEGGFHGTFETGVDRQRRFDAHLHVYGQEASVIVEYDTPYIRHLPTTKIVEETVGESFRRTVDRPTFKDAYTVELEYFHDCVVQGVAPKTSIEDAKEDLRLIGMIMDAMI